MALVPIPKKTGIIWNYHGNQRLAEERKKEETRRKHKIVDFNFHHGDRLAQTGRCF